MREGRGIRQALQAQGGLRRTQTASILSSLVDYYGAEELPGKVIPVITNLKPAKIFGEMSYGMRLAAEIDDQRVLLTTDKPIENEAKIT